MCKDHKDIFTTFHFRKVSGVPHFIIRRSLTSSKVYFPHPRAPYKWVPNNELFFFLIFGSQLTSQDYKRYLENIPKTICQSHGRRGGRLVPIYES